MKDSELPQNQKPAARPMPTAATNFARSEPDESVAPQEVARRAYSSYVKQGSPSGHEVRHWLAAEAELLAERKRQRNQGKSHSK
jgi:hypothetical protein